MYTYGNCTIFFVLKFVVKSLKNIRTHEIKKNSFLGILKYLIAKL